jgi:2-oxoglutarate ferredoxin oxidoreductase subunit beta
MKAIHESMAKGEFLTGLLYINPTQPPLPQILNLVDAPLASLGEDVLKPSPAVLDHLMQSLM